MPIQDEQNIAYQLGRLTGTVEGMANQIKQLNSQITAMNENHIQQTEALSKRLGSLEETRTLGRGMIAAMTLVSAVFGSVITGVLAQVFTKVGGN